MYKSQLQNAMFDVDDAANAYGAALDDDGALDVPDARAFAKHVAVSKLAAIRGLDSKSAYAAFLKHVDVVAEWRRERAAWLKERKEEGYTDRRGVKRSAADLAAKAERDAAKASTVASHAALRGIKVAAPKAALKVKLANNSYLGKALNRSVAATTRLAKQQYTVTQHGLGALNRATATIKATVVTPTGKRVVVKSTPAMQAEVDALARNFR